MNMISKWMDVCFEILPHGLVDREKQILGGVIRFIATDMHLYRLDDDENKFKTYTNSHFNDMSLVNNRRSYRIHYV